MVKLNNEIIINKQYIIQSYEILYINLKLNESASIYIMIFYNDTESIEKNFILNGDEYLKWDNDNETIEKDIIFYFLFTIYKIPIPNPIIGK